MLTKSGKTYDNKKINKKGRQQAHKGDETDGEAQHVSASKHVFLYVFMRFFILYVSNFYLRACLFASAVESIWTKLETLGSCGFDFFPIPHLG